MAWSIRATSDTEFIAEVGDATVGRAGLTLSRRHPDLAMVDLTVENGWRREGIGSDLIAAMAESTDRRLLANIEPDPSIEAFLDAVGLERVVESEVRTVDLDALEPVDAPDAVEIRTHETITAELATLYDEIYRRCHRWGGRYTPPTDQPWIGFLGPAVPGAVVSAQHEGRPVAVVSLHAEADDFGADADVFLAPTSVLIDAPLTARAPVLGHLVGSAWSVARAAGYTSCATEFDTPYDDLAAVATSVPGTVASRRQLWLTPQERSP